ncbi:S8 family peptidase [Streptomyces sp. ME02-8801-2C]|uniref:S8 family peptidase n=1 Tax=Streptomyces sp. ME02-8801-2C TaxID=3028680 RepID=UPI0029B4C405|nr:S8 family peptidase [Streptomyces sp. ME02-8801-2C]MDX3453920.1 S8 family peptidase [Streptomyces sp. ME02-8801-2C]
MPQQHPGRRRTVGRRATSLLAPALAGGMLLTYSPLAQAAQTSPVESTGQTRTFTAGTYLVQMADAPVATYAKTAPAPGKRLNTRTGAVRDYVEHLKRQREKVLDEVPGVRPLYSYRYVFNGFAAHLTARQANALARTPGVVSLARNEARQVDATTDTTDSAATAGTAAASSGTSATGSLPVPDTAKFLGLKDPGGLYSKVPGGQANAGRGLIIGVIDTGIAPDNPSLAALPEPRPDAEVIAKKWKGSCDPGADQAHQVTCNNKVIGAQYFNKGLADPIDSDWASPRDSDAHGTHTATTAAGNIDVPATVPDTGISGRISGLAPAARIAAYKACWHDGCWSVDLVAAYDKAVADGVDVINYSIGGGNGERTNIPEYTAMFNAAKAGVFVSTSAGNSGPGTVSNNVPWVTTTAASSHDLDYRTTITLGDGTSYTGTGTSGSAVPSAPLVDAAKAALAGADPANAELCKADSLDPAKIKGAIVLCKRGDNARVDKSAQVKVAGGAGMVLYNANTTDETDADGHSVPSVHLDNASGLAVKAYADSASGATADLGAAKGVHQEAPEVTGFSSGGPDLTSGGDQLKPDITAPGLNIVAGTTPGGGDGAFKGEQGLMSGTSMSSPHVAGLALLLRQAHPDWSPMEIKSALMTTATTKDEAGEAIRRAGSDGPATPLDYGSGHVVPNTADNPGLVYDSNSADWTSYMCALGDKPVTADGSDVCATAREIDASDLNTPNISVGDLTGRQTVTRTVTNVTATTGVYTAKLQTPHGYKAEVTPKRLVVPAGGSATYKVTFTRTDAAFGDWVYGSVTLSDKDGHRVRSAVALRAKQLTAPGTATGENATGSVVLSPQAGWKGTFTTKVNGLYAGTTKTGTLTGTAPDFGPPPAQLTSASVKTEITVPEGTALARVALRSADLLPGSDVDLWVFDKDRNLLSHPDEGNDEQVDLGPGTYTVYVNQFALPEGVTGQPYTLHTWLIGPTTKPDRQATATPAKRKVTQGDIVRATVSWHGLTPGSAYVGLVEYGDGTDTAGSTILTVEP